jgi:hypothetical protein
LSNAKLFGQRDALLAIVHGVKRVVKESVGIAFFFITFLAGQDMFAPLKPTILKKETSFHSLHPLTIKWEGKRIKTFLRFYRHHTLKALLSHLR